MKEIAKGFVSGRAAPVSSVYTRLCEIIRSSSRISSIAIDAFAGPA